MKKILITSYVNPDLDGVAGIMAYAFFLEKMGIKSTVGTMGDVGNEVKYIFDRFGFNYPAKIQNSKDFDDVVLIDTSDLNSIEGNIEVEKVIQIIDHRIINESDEFPNAKIQIERVGAVVTLIVEKFIENNIEIPYELAVLLLSAIISNTVNLKSGVTTDRGKKIAEYLNKTAKLPEDFWKEFFIAKSDLSGDKLAKHLIDDFVWYVMNDKKIGIAQIEVVGVEKLIKERELEMIETMNKIKNEMNLDFIFQNCIELEKQENYFVTDDKKTQELLKKVLKIEFNGNVAHREGLLMRKQISPLLKEELERNY